MLGVFGAVAPVNALPFAIEFVAGEVRMKGFQLQPEDISAISFRLKPQGYAANTEGDSLVIKQVSGP
jgi:general secretion pathway protein L